MTFMSEFSFYIFIHLHKKSIKMDVMLQRHCAKYIYVVPDGLRELMSDISREVLRSQPEQIYSFIADYLDALMITRENARVAARFVENLTEVGVTIVELLLRTGMTREEADRVATVIQVAFRRHLADKIAMQQRKAPEVVDEANIITEIINEAGITPQQAEEAATIIQHAYRLFKQRQERETDLLKGMVDWRVAARSTMRLYRKTGVTYEEANRAATLIKAAYKGYYTRRIMKKLLEQSEEVSLSETASLQGEASEYPPYWEDYEETVEDQFKFTVKEEELKISIKREIPQDAHGIAASIVESLLHHAVPGSDTSLFRSEAGPVSHVTPPPPLLTAEEHVESGHPVDSTEPSSLSPEAMGQVQDISDAPTVDTDDMTEVAPGGDAETDRTEETNADTDVAPTTDTDAEAEDNTEQSDA